MATEKSLDYFQQYFEMSSRKGKGQSTEGQSTEGRSNEGQSTEGQSNEGQGTAGQSNEGQSTEGQSNEDQSTKGQSNDSTEEPQEETDVQSKSPQGELKYLKNSKNELQKEEIISTADENSENDKRRSRSTSAQRVCVTRFWVFVWENLYGIWRLK